MKGKPLSIFFFLLGIIGTACYTNTPNQESPSVATNDSPIVEVLEMETYLTQLKEEQRPHHFVDVRTPEEVAEGTIDNAINIDYRSDDFLAKFQQLDKNQPVYLFCRSGNRSGKASKLLVDSGFKEIYDLKGGYSAYSAQIQE